jgi:hypothetical protein
VGKVSKIFCENLKVLLFEYEKYKKTNIWKLQHWQKCEDLYVKIRLKTNYDKVQGLIQKRYELF